MVKLQELNDYQKDLVAKHYADALKIGQSFKSSVMFDDEKENVAIHALWRAAQKYDENHNSKAGFQTYLYRSVINSLLSYGRRNRGNGQPYEVQKKRLPKSNLLYESTIEARAAQQGRVENLSTMFAAYDDTNTLEFQELMEKIQLRLTEQQRFILNSRLSDVTFEEIAKKLKLSRQRIHQKFARIQQIVKRVLKQQQEK